MRILVVDDYQPWRRFVCTMLENHPESQLVGEVSDGLEAVYKSQELRPDLILLDIGLPSLNGIEAARRILQLSPQPKILFVSENHSVDIAIEALRSGGSGYVVKSNAASELLPAVDAVLQGRRFISRNFAGSDLVEMSYPTSLESFPRTAVGPAKRPPYPVRERGHVVQFYRDDGDLLDGLCASFMDALSAGASVAALLTRSHQKGLEKRLMAQGIDGCEAKNKGRLVIVEVGELLNGFMEADGPNRERFLLQVGNIIRRAEAAAVAKTRRVVAFGEAVAVLWKQRKCDAAICIERLWNELALNHSFYLCCLYPASLFQGKLESDPYAAVCAEHSEVVSALCSLHPAASIPASAAR